MIKEEVPNKISEFRHLYKSIISEKLKEKGIDDLDTCYGHIIFNLLKRKKLTMKQLSKNVNRDKSTITVLVRNLEKKNYVEKIENPKDQRSKFIVLTEKGKGLENVFFDISKSVVETMWKDIDKQSQEEFMAVLDKLSDNLTESISK